jgi:phospholipid/cholesterol/gamma-HCH transport system substrate-binding protein
VPDVTVRDRNPVTTAVVGTLVLVGLVAVALASAHLPLLHPRNSYAADLPSAGGLRAGDEVRVAGMPVGTVASVALTGDHVRAVFRVDKGVRLGGGTTADVKVATVLDKLFLQLDRTATPGRLAPGATIPRDRTTVPYSLVEALSGVAQRTQQTDLAGLDAALRTTVASASGVDAAKLHAVLSGLATVSGTVAASQDQIAQLVAKAATVTSTLASRAPQLVTLLAQGDTFLAELQKRRAVIHQLLLDTTAMGSSIAAVLSTNAAVLTPLLDRLSAVAGTFAKNEQAIDAVMTTLGPLSRYLANATGSGPYLDILGVTGLIPDNVVAACGVHPTPRCGQ